MKDVKALIKDLVGQLEDDNGDDIDDLIETKQGLLTAFLLYRVSKKTVPVLFCE